MTDETCVETETISIHYRLQLPDGRSESFGLRFDPHRFELLRSDTGALPAWTALDYHQCPHCALDRERVPHCPLAASVADVVHRFDDILSHSEITLEVITPERRVSQHTTAQRAIGSLMGLLIATSGCPHTAVFRPMARFHLPLATADETLYRVASMFLLGQHFARAAGACATFDIDGVQEIYRRVHAVNVAVARRLRAATSTDSSVNALITLDVFAIDIPFAMDESLERIAHLFEAYLE
jgi:hypothetical protein